MSVLIPVQCFDYCSFAVVLKLGSVSCPILLILFQDYFGYLTSLKIPYVFLDGFFLRVSTKNSLGDFDMNYIESVDFFG